MSREGQEEDDEEEEEAEDEAPKVSLWHVADEREDAILKGELGALCTPFPVPGLKAAPASLPRRRGAPLSPGCLLRELLT